MPIIKSLTSTPTAITQSFTPTTKPPTILQTPTDPNPPSITTNLPTPTVYTSSTEAVQQILQALEPLIQSNKPSDTPELTKTIINTLQNIIDTNDNIHGPFAYWLTIQGNLKPEISNSLSSVIYGWNYSNTVSSQNIYYNRPFIIIKLLDQLTLLNGQNFTTDPAFINFTSLTNIKFNQALENYPFIYNQETQTTHPYLQALNNTTALRLLSKNPHITLDIHDLQPQDVIFIRKNTQYPNPNHLYDGGNFFFILDVDYANSTITYLHFNANHTQLTTDTQTLTDFITTYDPITLTTQSKSNIGIIQANPNYKYLQSRLTPPPIIQIEEDIDGFSNIQLNDSQLTYQVDVAGTKLINSLHDTQPSSVYNDHISFKIRYPQTGRIINIKLENNGKSITQQDIIFVIKSLSFNTLLTPLSYNLPDNITYQFSQSQSGSNEKSLFGYTQTTSDSVIITIYHHGDWFSQTLGLDPINEFTIQHETGHLVLGSGVRNNLQIWQPITNTPIMQQAIILFSPSSQIYIRDADRLTLAPRGANIRNQAISNLPNQAQYLLSNIPVSPYVNSYQSDYPTFLEEAYADYFALFYTHPDIVKQKAPIIYLHMMYYAHDLNILDYLYYLDADGNPVMRTYQELKDILYSIQSSLNSPIQ